MRFDHIAIAAPDLDSGAAYVEAALGVPLVAGGNHRRYGTHNRLLGLADGIYLEVIAIDRDAPAAGPRWFALDEFDGPPRIVNWICAVDDLPEALASSLVQAGEAVDLERGALRWRIGVPRDGSLPMEGQYPTLMEWGKGVVHPARQLPASGVRLSHFTVRGPQAEAIGNVLAVTGPALQFETAATTGFEAVFETPSGERRLS